MILMMKASEWANKFLMVPQTDGLPEQTEEERYAEVLKLYGEETAKLFSDRTKSSKPESKLPAGEGAIREQRSKFRAVCNRVPGLSESLFDKVVDDSVPEYKIWAAMVVTKKKKTQQDDVKEYRKNRFK